MEGFQNTWVMALSAVAKRSDDEILEHCYFQQVKNLWPLSEDIPHYKRCDESHVDHTCQHLYDAVDRHIRIGALSRGLQGNTNRAWRYTRGARRSRRQRKGKDMSNAKANAYDLRRPRLAQANVPLISVGGAPNAKECVFFSKGTCRSRRK